ncbi:tetratricopeptide repeat protein [Polynucleobacter paneuropaeus]|uniref:tetratricopeptide repeat protein n=1 Tax=Polynucleobacter paludilacus TaxID=1855895 RepID=UPI001BFCEBB7|nr:tetratricopeptide repeat protein [Polynucleobacter paludilacus]QWD12322.1 tetratricopeptide repeat protein [Polynucleobacter paneuropaeus]QWD86782.1 tetratricopeptide repeat protein [Polynucleobacter paludilacus]
MNQQIAYLINLSIQQIQSGRLDDAERTLNQVIRVEPKNANALSFLSIIFAYRSDFHKALTFIEKSLQQDPGNPDSHSNKGNILKELGRTQEALDCYQKSISISPMSPEPYNNLGNLQQDLGEYSQSLVSYEKAISLNPNYVEAYSNRGNTLQKMGFYDESLEMYEIALNLKPNYVDAWLNKALVLNNLKKFNEALAACDQAIALDSQYSLGWTKKANILNENGYHQDALQLHDRALLIDSGRPESWADRALCLIGLKRYEEAIDSFQKSLIKKKDLDFLIGDVIYAKLQIALWDGLVDEIDEVSRGVLIGKKVINPLKLLSAIDSSKLALDAARIWVETKYPTKDNLPQIKKYSHPKIRVAYFSADFRNHPVSLLTAELFKLHDRNKFEVFAFSCKSTDANDEVRTRLKERFDHFIEIEDLTDLESAKLARDYEIDIAVDLGGHTQYAPTGIMSYRAAPIQVNYLGFPGTMGAQYIDYIIADHALIPAEAQQFYSEKVVYLPDTYMVDDSDRIASDRAFSKQECGLPEHGFVFCCLNNGYKFNKKITESWARILNAVPDSILWISENNDVFKKNILREFMKLGVIESRVIFATRLDLMSDYLARYRLADLFLDTNPYNAHTTAVDALKSGVPVLTCLGETFSSRVGGSLLKAIGLPELVASSLGEYERIAIDLATNPVKLKAIKNKLIENKGKEALFDTKRFVKNIEAAYIQMYRRYIDGTPLDHIFI